MLKASKNEKRYDWYFAVMVYVLYFTQKRIESLLSKVKKNKSENTEMILSGKERHDVQVQSSLSVSDASTIQLENKEQLLSMIEIRNVSMHFY